MNNRELLTRVCREIEPLLTQLVLVGGCSTELLITDQAAPHPRPTQDVDMVVNAVSLNDYYKVESKLRDCGFTQSMDEQGIICRWLKGDLKLDVMPTDKNIFGFTNCWYSLAIEQAVSITFEGMRLNHINAAVFIATKLEAFDSRGKADFMMSHDLEDLISVIDGRENIVEDIATSPRDVKDYLIRRIKGFLENSEFIDALPGFLSPDQAGQARLELLKNKLRKISGL